MKEVVLLVGPPGSGKSTLCSTEFSEFTRISQDDQGKDGHLREYSLALHGNSHRIVIDRMDFSKEQRKRYLDPAKAAGYSTRIVVLHTPRSVCMARANPEVRKDHPTIKNSKDLNKAVGFFFKSYERVTDDEADVVERRGWVSESGESCITVDLDGTLCNTDHRQPLILRGIENKKPDWKSFFDGIPRDPINSWCQEILYRFESFIPIILCSGRPDSLRDVTENWLDKFGVGYTSLIMRPRDDHRQDAIVKEILLEWEIKTRYNILFWLDDRKQVVDKIREHGVTVLQCALGNF